MLAVALTLSQRQTPNISFTQVRVTLQFNETKTTTEKYTSKISEAVAAKVPTDAIFESDPPVLITFPSETAADGTEIPAPTRLLLSYSFEDKQAAETFHDTLETDLKRLGGENEDEHFFVSVEKDDENPIAFDRNKVVVHDLSTVEVPSPEVKPLSGMDWGVLVVLGLASLLSSYVAFSSMKGDSGVKQSKVPRNFWSKTPYRVVRPSPYLRCWCSPTRSAICPPTWKQ